MKRKKGILLKGIESKTSNSFIRLYYFLIYRLESETLLDFYIDESKDELDKEEKEKINAYITEKLIDYYTLCIYTLYKVSCEKGLERRLAQDTFERLYSLYLFKNETDLLYEIVDQLATNINQNTNLTEIERINSYFQLLRYVLGMISDEGIFAIHRSPGIVHRVNLIKHIVKTKLHIDALQAFYPLLKFGPIDNMKRNEQILQAINIINQDYLAAEKIIKNMGYEKKLVHFWVISLSYNRCSS